MKTISFYRTSSGRCPVEEHLDTLNDAQVAKITWVLRLIRGLKKEKRIFYEGGNYG
jgi:hypothetical protein